MNKMRFLRLVVAPMLLVCAGVASGVTPDEFRLRQQREISNFREMRLKEFNAFRDSVNSQFAQFIEQQWKEMNTMRHSLGFNPPPLMVAPPRQQPAPEPPVPEPPQPPAPEPPQPTPEPPQQPIAPQERNATFYGRALTLNTEPLRLPQLRSTNSRDVADYWRILSRKADGVIDDLVRLENELGLDDWGAYRLAYELAPYYIDGINDNERVVFSVFVLCQRGFKCKMARSGNKLYPLIAMANQVYNVSYIEFSNDPVQYCLISNESPRDVEVCTADFPEATRKLDITPPQALPAIGGDRANMTREWSNGYGSDFSCSIDYDPEIVRYLGSYPCIDFKNYAEGPVDRETMDMLTRQLSEQMQGMDTEAKLNHLLHFVQFAFDYKTDQANYGFEKWNFPDETLIAAYTDCDDRAILWCRLVRELVDVPVALVNYPGVHLAAAAAIDPAPDYATVSSGSRTYVVCDPTYIGADAGMEMPPLANRTREVIPLF